MLKCPEIGNRPKCMPVKRRLTSNRLLKRGGAAKTPRRPVRAEDMAVAATGGLVVATVAIADAG
jgi:hypothetical protein